MAPEQARIAVDQRADVCVRFDPTTCSLVSRARRAGNRLAVLQARMEQAPPPVKSLCRKLPTMSTGSCRAA
jgi:hypothetical protein